MKMGLTYKKCFSVQIDCTDALYLCTEFLNLQPLTEDELL